MSAGTRSPAGAAALASGTLPFLDFPLWMVATALFGLMVVGFAVTAKLRNEDASS